jgi:hypothetical protein
MKVWIANLLWDALAIFLGRVHDYLFSPARAAAIRFVARQRWWAYTQQAASPTGKARHDMRAEYFRILFSFETPPADAVARGDIAKWNGPGQSLIPPDVIARMTGTPDGTKP